MKLLLASAEGEHFFDILDDLEIPGLEIARAATTADALTMAGDVEVYYGMPSAEIVAAAPRLRWIQSSSAGVEYIAKIPALVTSDVTVTNTRGAHGPSIGEHALALLLALTRALPTCWDQQRARVWDRGQLYRTCREIGGLTMGILGFGALGRGVARRALGFEMNLLAVDAQALDGEPFLDEVWPASRLPEMLELSDAIVVCAPQTPETRHLLDAAALTRMKPDAYLIVVSRGGIVVESALAEALHAGRLAGAALDVTEIEPLPADSPLWDAPNLILTPHTAGASAPKERRCVEILRDNLLRYANGDPLLNVVDKRLGY